MLACRAPCAAPAAGWLPKIACTPPPPPCGQEDAAARVSASAARAEAFPRRHAPEPCVVGQQHQLHVGPAPRHHGAPAGHQHANHLDVICSAGRAGRAGGPTGVVWTGRAGEGSRVLAGVGGCMMGPAVNQGKYSTPDVCQGQALGLRLASLPPWSPPWLTSRPDAVRQLVLRGASGSGRSRGRGRVRSRGGSRSGRGSRGGDGVGVMWRIAAVLHCNTQQS